MLPVPSFVTMAGTLAFVLDPDLDPASTTPAKRLMAVRGFTRYLSAIDPRTEVPPAGLVSYRPSRRVPYLFSDQDVAAVVRAARASTPSAFRAETLASLIVLLAVTGMRVGEALRLDCCDLDWDQAVIKVRDTKFGKGRDVAVSASTAEALAAYRCRRDSRKPPTTRLFVSLAGTPVIYSSFACAFRQAVRAAGVGAGGPVRPRVHDLRHSFAVRTLVGWYRAGLDVGGPAAQAVHLPRAPGAALHLPVPHRHPRAARSRRSTPGGRPGDDPMTAIAPTLESWFTDRLGRQRQASPRTIASYRDTLRLLMCFMQARTGKAPSSLDWDDLSEEAISAFLDHLETERHNGPRTRNLRLTAIRSLFRYAALRHPEHAAVIQRVLAIPAKRFTKAAISFLTASEAAALIDAPDQRRWEGRRDRALLMLALQTGLRVSELIGLDCADVVLGAGGHVRCEGKGRRQRAVPLTSSTQHVLRAWMSERAGRPRDPLFPTRTGRRLSPDAIERRVAIHASAAAKYCPSLQAKRLHPHVLRHSCAMALLQARVDVAVLALWLGHADIRSTDAYIHADLTIKERALALTTPATAKPGRYQPPNRSWPFSKACNYADCTASRALKKPARPRPPSPASPGCRHSSVLGIGRFIPTSG